MRGYSFYWDGLIVMVTDQIFEVVLVLLYGSVFQQCWCVIPTLLFPHVQIGKTASYAYPYLLGTATSATGPALFVLSRIWYLIVQVFSIHYPRISGLEWQGGADDLAVIFRSCACACCVFCSPQSASSKFGNHLLGSCGQLFTV